MKICKLLIILLLIGCSNENRITLEIIKEIDLISAKENPTTSNHLFYITDIKSNRILKYSENGDLSYYAGSGKFGLLNADINNAEFYWPKDVVVDSEANLFVTDNRNNVIRKILSNGSVITFVGNGEKGNDDAKGEDARFFLPIGLTIDNKDNLFVSDNGNHTIKKITPEGVVTTIAVGKSDLMWRPKGLVSDNRGNLFISSDNYIVKISKKGNMSIFAGKKNSLFSNPTDIVIDEKNNLYVADKGNGKVFLITPKAKVSTVLDFNKIDKNNINPEKIILAEDGYIYIVNNRKIYKTVVAETI